MVEMRLYEVVMGAYRPLHKSKYGFDEPHRYPEYWTEKEKSRARSAQARYTATRRNKTAKERAFIHYCNGPPCCAHCGNTDIRVLELHHTNFDGKEHRERHGGNLSYSKLEKEGYPTGLLSLCSNCHIIVHSS